jgi:GDP-L-fucose synthase
MSNMDDFWGARRFLVTGGTGFLGRTICQKLKQLGASEMIAPRSRDFDLTRPDDVEKLFADAAPDIVIHAAARVGGIGFNQKRPAELYLANLLMGTFVIDEARKREIDKTVILGTICAYPKYTPVPFSEDDLWEGYPEETNAPYGIAKKALLVHAHANRLQYGQNCIYLLPVNLYGPGDKFHPSVSHVIPAMIKKFVEAKESGERTVEVWGSGRATREFLFVEDAADGILAATRHFDSPDPVNLGSGREISIRDLAELIKGLVGYDGELIWDPDKPDGQPRRRLDTRRAEVEFGWRAQMLLEDGLRATIDWYLAHRAEAEVPPT